MFRFKPIDKRVFEWLLQILVFIFLSFSAENKYDFFRQPFYVTLVYALEHV